MKRSLQSLIACSLLGRVAHASDLRVPEEKARAGVAASDRLASGFRCPVTRPLCLSTVSFPWLSVQCLCGLITRRGRTDRQCDVPCFGLVSGSGGTRLLVPRLEVPAGFPAVPPVRANSASARTCWHLARALRLPPPAREVPLGSSQVHVKPHLHSCVVFTGLFSDRSTVSTLHFFINIFPKGTLLPKLALCACLS